MEDTAFVYLLVEREFRRVGAPHVFKIGRSEVLPQRAKQYPKGSKVLAAVAVEGIGKQAEDALKAAFAVMFVPRRDVGLEYFQVVGARSLRQAARVMYASFHAVIVPFMYVAALDADAQDVDEVDEQEDPGAGTSGAKYHCESCKRRFGTASGKSRHKCVSDALDTETRLGPSRVPLPPERAEAGPEDRPVASTAGTVTPKHYCESCKRSFGTASGKSRHKCASMMASADGAERGEGSGITSPSPAGWSRECRSVSHAEGGGGLVASVQST